MHFAMWCMKRAEGVLRAETVATKLLYGTHLLENGGDSLVSCPILHSQHYSARHVLRMHPQECGTSDGQSPFCCANQLAHCSMYGRSSRIRCTYVLLDFLLQVMSCAAGREAQALAVLGCTGLMSVV